MELLNSKLFEELRSIIYRIALNSKWYFSSIARCIIGGVFFTIPMVLAQHRFHGSFKELLEYEVEWNLALGMTVVLSLLFWIIGFGLSNYHPPITWKAQIRHSTILTVNLVLALPIILFLVNFLGESSRFNFPIISAVLTFFISIPTLIFINSKIRNEDAVLAEKINREMKLVDSKTKLKRARVSALFLAAMSLVSIFMLVGANIENNEKDSEILNLKMELLISSEEYDDIIDSLSRHIEKLEQTSSNNQEQ